MKSSLAKATNPVLSKSMTSSLAAAMCFLVIRRGFHDPRNGFFQGRSRPDPCSSIHSSNFDSQLQKLMSNRPMCLFKIWPLIEIPMLSRTITNSPSSSLNECKVKQWRSKTLNKVQTKKKITSSSTNLSLKSICKALKKRKNDSPSLEQSSILSSFSNSAIATIRAACLIRLI